MEIKETNKGGKKLMKMCDMEILNLLDDREETWSRIENGRGPVIDYI